MCKDADIQVLVCDEKKNSMFEFNRIFDELGLGTAFFAETHEQALHICKNELIDIILFETNFAGSKSFDIGDEMSIIQPQSFLLFFSSVKDTFNPLKTITTNGVGFIQKQNKKELFDKVSLWVKVAKNVRNVKEYIDGQHARSPQRIFA